MSAVAAAVLPWARVLQCPTLSTGMAEQQATMCPRKCCKDHLPLPQSKHTDCPAAMHQAHAELHPAHAWKSMTVSSTWHNVSSSCTLSHELRPLAHWQNKSKKWRKRANVCPTVHWVHKRPSQHSLMDTTILTGGMTTCTSSYGHRVGINMSLMLIKQLIIGNYHDTDIACCSSNNSVFWWKLYIYVHTNTHKVCDTTYLSFKFTL